ncbi:MAG: hypothetical protein LH614_13695 [Pyrinomonadaceae bacterium]|nr:hypothetical protein [Pyrinomonadaceae bacterium]
MRHITRQGFSSVSRMQFPSLSECLINPKFLHFKRLHILTSEEIPDIFHLPIFTDEERLVHIFSTEVEFEVVN